MFNFVQNVRKSKIAVFIFLFFLLLIPVALFILGDYLNRSRSIYPSPTSPTITPVGKKGSITPTQTQKQFRVIETSPKNGEINAYPGEISIIFKTDVDIISSNSFFLEIAPPLPYYWKIENAYPTKQIKAQVFGGLQTNTKYTMSVLDQNKNLLYLWTFTTSATPAESSSRYFQEKRNEIVNKYYPLFDYIPFSSSDFNIDYTDRLTLKVVIKNKDLEKVKQEVLEWIKSHGVDPSTHTITYINQF